MSIYEEYKKVEDQIVILEEKKEILRKEIASNLPDEGIQNQFVTAFWKTTKKWTYSPKVKGLETELKATKKEEEEKGIATSEETKQLNIKCK